jgi:alpha-tubulin suppressor-like RCC1 family protein
MAIIHPGKLSCYLRRASVALGSAVTASACSPSAAPSSTGTLQMSLSTQLNGVAFQLQGAHFDVNGPEHVTLTADSSDAESLRTSLSTGDYEILLQEGWRLARQAQPGAVFEPVSAQLISANPTSFRILDGETTAVSYVFRVDEAVVQLGQGNLDLGIRVSEVPTFQRRVVHLAAGAYHTCAILADGSSRCWGWDEYSQLGYSSAGDVGDDESPASAGDLPIPPAREIAAGDEHTCALLESGAVRCWGWSDYGQLGAPSDQYDAGLAPDVDLGGPVQQLAAGWTYSCALLENGAVRCWGDGEFGSLGYGTTDVIGDDEAPASAGDVDVGGPVKQISARFLHTCALLTTGKVRCWGANGSNFSGAEGVGALGYGNDEVIGDDETPASAGDVEVGGAVQQIAAGGDHTCALLTSGSVRCWGDGRRGPLGYGNTRSIGDDESPAAAGDVEIGGPVQELAAGMNHTCALLTNGSVRCWGYNGSGQLGYGNTDDIGDDERPVAAGDVPVGGSVREIVAGAWHTCALLTTGAVRCWGDNSFGQLGYGNTSSIGDDESPAAAGDVPVLQ